MFQIIELLYQIVHSLTTLGGFNLIKWNMVKIDRLVVMLEDRRHHIDLVNRVVIAVVVVAYAHRGKPDVELLLKRLGNLIAKRPEQRLAILLVYSGHVPDCLFQILIFHIEFPPLPCFSL